MPTFALALPKFARFVTGAPANRDVVAGVKGPQGYRERQSLRESAQRILATSAQYFLMPLPTKRAEAEVAVPTRSKRFKRAG